MFKRKFFLFAMALACMFATAQESNRYTYIGEDTLLDGKLFLHKGMNLSLSRPLQKDNNIDLALLDDSNFVNFKAKLDKVLKKSDIQIETVNIEKVENLNGFENNSDKEQFVGRLDKDSLHIVHNGLNEVIDIYRDGKFYQQIHKGANAALVGEWSSYRFIAPSHSIVSEDDSEGIEKTEKSWIQHLIDNWIWYALIVAVLIILGVLLYLFKERFSCLFGKKGKHKKNASDRRKSRISEDDFVETGSIGDLTIGIPNQRKKDKLLNILQKITLPEDKIVANDYINQIADYYETNFQGDKRKIVDTLTKKYSQKESSDIKLKLRVRVSVKEPEETEENEWEYISKFKKWVKYIPIKSKKEESNKSADLWESIKEDLEELKKLMSQVEKSPATSSVGVTDSFIPSENGQQEIVVQQEGEQPSQESGSLLREDDNLNAIQLLESLSRKLNKMEEDRPSLIENEVKKMMESMIEKGEVYTREQLDAKIKSEKKKWDENVEYLKKQVKELDLWKDKCNKERSAKEAALRDVDSLKAIIQRMEVESREYISRLLFFKSCQPFANKAVVFLDTLYAIKTESAKLYVQFINSGKDGIDDLSYYMQRADSKLNSAVAQINEYDELCSELRSLAATGLVTNGKMLHKLLCSTKNEKEQEHLLQEKLYRDLFSIIAGAAVTMADEYAYVLPQYVAGVDKSIAKTIEGLSQKLQKQLADMGYKLCYARPLTPITEYVDVENCGSKDGSGRPRNTILEIKEMALLFGTVRKKTQVTIQK